MAELASVLVKFLDKADAERYQSLQNNAEDESVSARTGEANGHPKE